MIRFRDAQSLLALRRSLAKGKLHPRLADQGASPNNLQALAEDQEISRSWVFF